MGGGSSHLMCPVIYLTPWPVSHSPHTLACVSFNSHPGLCVIHPTPWPVCHSPHTLACLHCSRRPSVVAKSGRPGAQVPVGPAGARICLLVPSWPGAGRQLGSGARQLRWRGLC
eukprot:366045-Chlamydomonas_euryale.AAC.12